MSFIGNSLANPTILNLPATPVTDSVSTTNLLDTYRFTLTPSSSHVNLVLSGLSADANVALIRDANANNVVDSGEVLASSTNLGSLTELVNQSGLAAGNYFIQVRLNSGTSTSYSLNLTTTSQLKNDIIWRNSTSGDLGSWASNSATYSLTALTATTTPTAWVVEGTGDFNGDRVDDLLMRNTSDGMVQIQFMSEAGVSSSSTVLFQGQAPLVPSAYIVAGIGDVNGDGKSDIVWRNETTQNPVQSVGVWMMDGATVMSSKSVVASNGSALPLITANFKINAVADFDGDNKADILFRDANTGQMIY